MRSSLLAAALLAGCGGGKPPAAAEGGRAAHDHGHGHQGPIGHRFEKAEDWVAVFDDPERDAWQKPAEVVALLELSEGMVVADLGAGTGYFEPHLSRAVGASGRVLALDVEADMVRHLTERAAREGLANVTAAQVPFDDPKLDPESVDRVLVVNTWHHIPSRGVYSRKLAAALKPGGRVMVVDFTMESDKGPPKQHRLLPEVVIEELASAGLEARAIDESLPDSYIVVASRPR